MPRIELLTPVNAPIAVVFNLSRSIDLHKLSTAHTNEQAIAGRTTGLIEMGESVTWQAKHLGITQTLTSKITACDYPNYFADEMVRGAFKSFIHEHIFTESNGVVTMVDVFTYQSPLGTFGKLADILFLKKYMENLLIKRNGIVKEFAEDEEKWKQVPGM